ncbi:hypothetical protein PR048_023615 [Dryococelus australis]|uniref:Uncharacterized protein n=1 Tax=Dryococelus australis TaxID=614101 RepID=A0ABQ9GUL8_9NEOP|nr:hypothetical protein PR048_023615 [Dryococelus australis]
METNGPPSPPKHHRDLTTISPSKIPVREQGTLEQSQPTEHIEGFKLARTYGSAPLRIRSQPSAQVSHSQASSTTCLHGKTTNSRAGSESGVDSGPPGNTRTYSLNDVAGYSQSLNLDRMVATGIPLRNKFRSLAALNDAFMDVRSEGTLHARASTVASKKRKGSSPDIPQIAKIPARNQLDAWVTAKGRNQSGPQAHLPGSGPPLTGDRQRASSSHENWNSTNNQQLPERSTEANSRNYLPSDFQVIGAQDDEKPLWKLLSENEWARNEFLPN